MKNEMTNDNRSPSATEDMIADLGATGAAAEQLRALLGDVAGLAHEAPEPSADVRALLGGAIPLRPRRRAALVAAAVGALAFGGVSAAAAANRLPDRVQEVVADATGGVVPHPVKPTNPPFDAPGHVANKPKATKAPGPDPARPTNAPSDAPGQIQKSTKPDPTAPGPAHPTDPGAHGRAHNPDKSNSSDSTDDAPHRGTDSVGKSEAAGKSKQD